MELVLERQETILGKQKILVTIIFLLKQQRFQKHFADETFRMEQMIPVCL